MITDFFMNALPWVACGLMVAIICAGTYYTTRKKQSGDAPEPSDGKPEKATPLSAYYYIASSIGYAAALIIMFCGNDTSHGIVWMCIASMFMCIGSAQVAKERKKKDGDGVK